MDNNTKYNLLFWFFAYICHIKQQATEVIKYFLKLT